MSVRLLAAVSVVAFLQPSIGFAAQDGGLAEAVKRQDKAAVRALLQRKVDVNAPLVDGTTATPEDKPMNAATGRGPYTSASRVTSQSRITVAPREARPADSAN